MAVPESQGVVQEFAPCDHGLYVANLLGGPSELLYYPRGSTRPRQIPSSRCRPCRGWIPGTAMMLVFGNVSY